MNVERIEELKEFAHSGDPCRFCGTAHDDVVPGPCPNIIAYRRPMAGDWFIGSNGNIEQARFEFTCRKFPILGRHPNER